MKGSKQKVGATSITTKHLEVGKSLQKVVATLEAKSSSQLDYEMKIKMARFNVKDKRNLAMEGEIISQDAKVESYKVDDVMIDCPQIKRGFTEARPCEFFSSFCKPYNCQFKCGH